MAPERIFGPSAEGERTYRASSTFFLLANALFVSLAALLPRLNLANVLLPAGCIGLLSVALLLLDLRRERRRLGFSGVLVLGSVGLYVGEIWNALGLYRQPDNLAVIDAQTYVLLAGYVIGLARAWELVGGRGTSTLMLSMLHPEHATHDPSGDAPRPAGGTEGTGVPADPTAAPSGLADGDAAAGAHEKDRAE